jgi:hemerythrin
MLIWKETYSIGVELIDTQHKYLFDIGNQAYSLLENDLQIDKYDDIALIIEDLRNYFKYHFKCEEDYMLKINYSRYEEHKKEHDNFIKKINSMQLCDIDKNQQKYILDLLVFLFNWISKHILEKDKLIMQL